VTKQIARTVPCLWFDDQAEAAARFYVSVFPKSKIGRIAYYGDTGPKPKGTVLTVEFTLDGQPYLALNGGPQFPFTEAVSFVVNCADQREVDYYWEKLSRGGQKVQCGWLTDKFGLSWQIVPTELTDMLTDRDPERADRVMRAVMGMKKLDIAEARKAYGEPRARASRVKTRKAPSRASARRRP